MGISFRTLTSWIGCRLGAAVPSLLFLAVAHAQQAPPVCSSVPCTEVHTVAASDQGVPLEFSFTIANAGSYQVTLTDLGAAAKPPLPQSPLAAVKLAVTSGTSIVGTPLSKPGSMTFTATPGDYVVHITGKPGSGLGSGPVGVTVTSSDGQTSVVSYSGTLALPPNTSVVSDQALVSDPLTVQSAGSYVVTLTDLGLPQALSTLSLAIADLNTGSLVSGTPISASASPVTVTLNQTDSYVIFVAAQASSTVAAGLFSVSVTPSGGGAAIYNKTVPVGNVTLLDNLPLAAGSYTISLTDLQLPHDSTGAGSPLTQLGAIVVQNGVAATPALAGGGSKSFTVATSGSTYQVFATAIAGANGGSYAATVAGGGGPAALSVARAVPATGGSIVGYSYDTSVSSGGSFTLNLTDFQFPSALTSVSAVAVQNGLTLGPLLTAAGSQTVSANAGPLTLLVFAQPSSSSAVPGGLFGLDLTATANGTVAFSSTQPVGALVSTRQISITTPGTYSVSVSDLGFPESFGGGSSELAAIVTTGTSSVGSIFSTGSFNFSAATGGNYVISLIAQPQLASANSPSDEAGTYALSVAAAPAPPSFSTAFQATPSSVASGGTVELLWNAQNATSCTASSSPSAGFSGTVPTDTSGSPIMSAALTVSTTFTLTCTGPGGTTAPQTATVSISAPTGHGGGGGLSVVELLLLAAMNGVVRARVRSAVRRQGSHPAH